MSKKQKKALWLTLSTLAISATVVVFAEARRSIASTFGAPSLSDDTAVRLPSGNQAQGQKPDVAIAAKSSGPVNIVRFTVYPEGIKPAEAHAMSGTVAVYIEDLGGVSSGLMIQNSHGARLGHVARLRDAKRGSIRLKLLPGQYKVFDATRPQRQATLIVR